MRALVVSIAGLAMSVLSLTTIAPACAQSVLDNAQPVEVYSASIEIYRGGALVSKPNVVLPAGKMARVEVTNDKDPDKGIRLDLTVSDAGLSKKKVKQTRISAVVHEKVGGAWVLLSEPGIIAPLQAQNSMQVDSPLGKLELRFIIVTKLVPALLISGPQACATASSQPMLIAGETPSIRQRCCSAACTNGSGNTLRCCEGSISCCDGVCGACCTTD